MAEVADTIIQIAKTAHEANRALCLSQGDNSQVPFDEAPTNIKASAIDGVVRILDGISKTPEDSHDSWCNFKKADGYVYGEIKDDVAKTHPCLVPYAQLPAEQKVKDAVFFAIVESFRKETDEFDNENQGE